MLPHPSRYKEYACKAQRDLMRAFSTLTVSAVEFLAMSLTVVVVLLKDYQQQTPIAAIFLKHICLLTTILLYIWSFLVSLCELFNVEWEYQRWGRATLQLARRGPDKKSKLTIAYTRANARVRAPILWSCAIAALIALFQNIAILVYEIRLDYFESSTTRSTSTKVPVEQERFLVAYLLFTTLAMSAGFFTQAQLTFEIEHQLDLKHTSQADMLRKILILEVVLTQILPLFLLAVGPYWTGHDTFQAFNFDWILWRGS
jgi:hypothetical protein